MNKKAQGLSLKTIIVAAIALIVLILLVMIFTGRLDFLKEEFNPETNVCLEYKSVFGGEIKYIDDYDIGFPEKVIDGDYYIFDLVHKETKQEIISTCPYYRQKTFCEKCSDNWDYTEIEKYYETGMWSISPTGRRTITCDDKCICDEWEIEKCITYINYNITYTNYAPPLKKDNQTSPDFLYEYDTCFHNITEIDELTNNIYGFIDVNEIEYKTFSMGNCLSAHNPSPCELGDENYILSERLGNSAECKKMSESPSYRGRDYCFIEECRLKTPCELGDERYVEDFDCYATEVNGIVFLPNEDNCPKKICRLKTLQDYSCQDLLYHILKDDSYCQYNEGWSRDTYCWTGYWTDTHKVVDIYKEKGCLEQTEVK